MQELADFDGIINASLQELKQMKLCVSVTGTI